MRERFRDSVNDQITAPILHINTARTWRGGEKQTLLLNCHLNRLGFKTAVICPAGSVLADRLAERSLPAYVVPLRSELDMVSAWQIAAIARRIQPGILHMHTAHAHTLGMLSSVFHRVPVNIVSRRVDFRIKGMLSRIKYRFPDRYIAVSHAVKRILLEDGIPEAKVTTVYSGVDLAEYESVNSKSVQREFGSAIDLQGKMKLVAVAALTPQKDHETLLHAMKLLTDRGRRCILFIVGDGELMKKLLALRDRLHLADHVVFTGFRNDAIDFIHWADIFVISSRWEGLGTSIIDAMALRKPIVATETGGIPELIDNGENGLLVEREDPEALARAVERLMDQPELRHKLSEGASRRAHAFSIEQTVAKTVIAYRNCLEEKMQEKHGDSYPAR
jgi:glycosyltransferase involved in cell wall biosynthesis